MLDITMTLSIMVRLKNSVYKVKFHFLRIDCIPTFACRVTIIKELELHCKHEELNTTFSFASGGRS